MLSKSFNTLFGQNNRYSNYINMKNYHFVLIHIQSLIIYWLTLQLKHIDQYKSTKMMARHNDALKLEWKLQFCID